MQHITIYVQINTDVQNSIKFAVRTEENKIEKTPTKKNNPGRYTTSEHDSLKEWMFFAADPGSLYDNDY